ncbi:MAG: M3 family oligoendopeptidase, partial [Clostridia bacterium]|nr:M3 family oligoendopeptidase [Clostridia bacterium]
HYKTGGWWQRQLHIFMDPFYYIDYCLAQSVALMFWAEAQKDRDKAWDKYMRLMQKSGTLTFSDLLASVNLADPMKPGALAEVASAAMDFLSSFDLSDL